MDEVYEVLMKFNQF